MYSIKKVLIEMNTNNGIFVYHLKNKFDVTVAIFYDKELALEVRDLLNEVKE